MINGRQNKVQSFDFSEKEQEYEYHKQQLEARFGQMMERYGDRWISEEEQTKREYQYFIPNREFSGKMEDMKLKKLDDGTFIDNGYR